HAVECLGLLGVLIGSTEEFEEPVGPALSPWWLEADHRQFVIGRVRVARLSPTAFLPRLPCCPQQTLGHLPSGGNCFRMRRKHTVNILRANASLAIACKEVIARGKATDNDDVRPAVVRERC